MFCGTSELSKLFHSFGAPEGTKCRLLCNGGYQAVKSVSRICGAAGQWTDGLGHCEETKVVILGGEDAGELVASVDVVTNNFTSSCNMAKLPVKIKWGNAGFVQNTILVCGGETELQDHNHDCWALDTTTRVWNLVAHLSR